MTDRRSVRWMGSAEGCASSTEALVDGRLVAWETIGETGGVSVVRCRVIVSGRVQGVFYRDSCRSMAIDLGVAGWVRNLSDGSVELAAEGTREAVDKLLEWCQAGPPHANVDALEIVDEAPRGDRHFRIVSGTVSLE
jgi:acylphosphatase